MIMRSSGIRHRFLTGIVFLMVSACGGDAAEEGSSQSGQVEMEGELIPVRGDPAGATYQLLDWSEQPNGRRIAMTRRDGSSGTSYARREVDCRRMQHRYLGEGDTRAEAEEDYSSPNTMSDLVAGSISAEITNFVCAKSR